MEFKVATLGGAQGASRAWLVAHEQLSLHTLRR